MRRKLPLLESTWTDVGPHRVHARVSVKPGGRSIVLLHGLVVSSRYMMPVARVLAPVFSVYVPDLPGFGRSSKPADVLDVPELADALAGWMHALELSPAAVLGHSFGCQIVAALVRRRPGCVERAVMVGPTTDPEGRTILQQAWRLTCDAPEMVSLAPVVLRDLYDAGLWRFWRTLQYMVEDRIEENLPHVEVPTLLVRGSKDPVAPQRWGEEATRLLPSGRLAVVPDAWHAPNFSAPEALACTIRPFLEAE